MDTLPPLQRGKGIFVNLTLDGICRLHLSGGHAKISLRIYEEAARWGDKDRSAAPKKAGDAMEKRQKTSLTMCLVAIGIVYGDIGTSPLYVMKSILEGNGGITQINESFIVGALSLIIWTITLLTTIKYVLIAMKADNHGEGGIFSLYSLVRSCGKWLIVPAMLGGAALLADGVLTPAVTVTSAVEGLRSIAMMDRLLGGRQTGVIIITLCIIASLFAVQHAGTSRIGKAFGPVMLVWFLFLGATGAMNIFSMPQVLRAFNPAHAVELLVSPYNKLGFMILGSVFLAATGAEALYSDMGHVGRESIYISWPLVKICLILNYLGQGAWLAVWRAVIAVGVAVLGVLLVRRRGRRVLAGAALVLCVLCYAGEWRINRWTYEVPARTAQQASALNDALAELDGRVLFIPYGVRQRDSQLIETYVARDVYIVEYETLLQNGALADGVLDLTAEAVGPEYPGRAYTDLDAADWVLAADGVPVDTTTLEKADAACPAGYVLYRNLDTQRVRFAVS